jgi:hypothetical protein
MKFKIYQAYYDKKQLSSLDPEFEPLDNTKNFFPEQREYPILFKCAQRGTDEGLDAWGYISWRRHEKMPKINGQFLIDLVNNNPGYDVYTFNPHAAESVLCVNVWEQGQKCHPHLIPIMTEMFPLLDIDPGIIYQLAPPDTMFFAQYIVAKKKFWQEYLRFLKKYVDNISNLSYDILQKHNSSANYQPDLKLWHFPFIIERLMPTFVLLNRDRYKVFNWQYYQKDLPDYVYDKLLFLKNSAIKYRDENILKEWMDYKFQHSPYDVSKNWTVKFG